MQICPSDFVPMQFQSWLCPAPALSKLVHSHAFHIELLGGMSGGWVRASTVRTLCTCLHCNGWTARMHKTQHHAPTAVCATQRLVTPQTKTYTHKHPPMQAEAGRSNREARPSMRASGNRKASLGAARHHGRAVTGTCVSATTTRK